MTFLVAITFAFILLAMHYEALLGLSKILALKKRHHRHDMLIVVSVILCTHLLEASIFAFVYWYRVEIVGLDNFNIKRELSAMDYFYFSVETYTTLGYGDMYLKGAARLLNSMEGLVGLLLLGWSSSFIFLYMKDIWKRIEK